MFQNPTGQNVLIPPDQNMPQGAKRFNTPILCTAPGNLPCLVTSAISRKGMISVHLVKLVIYLVIH